MVLFVFILAIFCLHTTMAFNCEVYIYGHKSKLLANKSMIVNETFDYFKTTGPVDNEYTLSFIIANGGCQTYGKQSLVALTTCPVGADAEIAAACQESASGLPPVWYRRGQVWLLFANAYCAFCRQVRDNLEAWSSVVNCINETEAARNVDKVTDKSCAVEFSPGIVYKKLVLCSKLVTPLKIKRCEPCTSPLKCRLCLLDSVIHPLCIPHVTQIIPGASLSILFDQPKYDYMALAKINGKLFKGSDLCNPDETFDSLFKKCRQISCPIGFSAKFGKCHQNTTVYVQPALLPFANGTNSVTVALNLVIFDFKSFIPMNVILKQLTAMTRIDIIVVDEQFRRSTVRVNIADILFEQLFNILGQVKLRGSTLEMFIVNFKDETEVTDACGIESFRCFQNPYSIYQRDSIFAKVNISNFNFFFRIEHTFYNLSMSSTRGSIQIIKFCVCETSISPYFLSSSSSSSSQNCSFIWYRYTPDEYIILENNVLEIVDTNLRFTPSEYQIEKNSTALICFDPSKLDLFLDMDPLQQYISWAFSGISIVFLILTITLNIKFKEIRKLPAKLTTCLAISLACGQFLLIAPKIGKGMCRYTAALTHFCWLSAFMWMSAQAIQMLLTFHPATLRVSSERAGQTMFYKYCIMCLSIPLLIVVPSFILEVVPGNHVRLNYGVTSCGWISNMNGSIVTFFVPVGVTLIINIVCFGLTLYYIQRALSGLAKVSGKTGDRNMCLVYLTLSSVLGFSWIFGFIAAFAKIQALWYIYIVLNGLQGVFVFLSFTINMTKRRITKSKNTKIVQSSTVGT